MELDLSLGDTSKPGGCMERHGEVKAFSKVSRLSMGLSLCQSADSTCDNIKEDITQQLNESVKNEKSSVGSPIQLDLLPRAPILFMNNNHVGHQAKRIPALIVADESPASSNSARSSLVEICLQTDRSQGNNNRRNKDKLVEEPANVLGKSGRKLRLSKEQLTFLEQSFKEHYTLNPKQKNYLAKQLNLRPRQVEVWFQNRRARTKLKQTELDFNVLKRWCEALKEENRRLEREVQALRATPKPPLYFRSPAIGRATTICHVCRRISELNSNTNTTMNVSKTVSFLF